MRVSQIIQIAPYALGLSYIWKSESLTNVIHQSHNIFFVKVLCSIIMIAIVWAGLKVYKKMNHY